MQANGGFSSRHPYKIAWKGYGTITFLTQFSPSGQLYYEYIQVALPAPAPSDPTAIDEISQETKAKSQKLIENGQLLIIRDGKTYNAQGALVK